MKKLIMFFSGLMFIAFAGYQANAQVRKIPASVTDSFKQKYPAASKVEWKDQITNFGVSFQLDSAKCDAKFSNKGQWQETEQNVKKENLPVEVTDGLSKSKYADWAIKSAIKIDLPGNVTQYRLRVVKSDIQKKVLTFSNEGRLLKDNSTL